jgi:DNA helicase HerA-like ATPase
LYEASREPQARKKHGRRLSTPWQMLADPQRWPTRTEACRLRLTLQFMMDVGAVAAPTRTVVIIEEAHEFLSAERIEKAKTLFQQVARIAKRGRKRWLGLVFVTQLPQHLPRQVFGLVNSYILHKITDAEVVSTLRRTVSGVDAGLWDRLTGLAPGQAIVSFSHMAWPLLVSIDPTPAELRLVY